jgi:hypothetical protein
MYVLPTRLPMDVRVAVADLADRQLGVVRHEQLLDVGVADHQIDYMLDSRRWQDDAGRLVIVMHNGPLTAEQTEAVAVLAGGRLCALAAKTAAARVGLTRWPAYKVEVVVPRGTTYPALRLVDVKVHESRRFTADDVHTATWPPRVRIERALVDAAVWSTRPRTACGLLAAGVQQRLTTADRLLAELERAGSVRFRRLLGCALVDIAGGAHAVSEIDFGRFCRRNGLPPPVRQVARKDNNGRRRYLDATLVGPSGRVVRVEIDGALHLVVETYWDDMYRDNELSIARETQIRLPSYVMHADEPNAVDQLKRALGLSGPSGKVAA